jgi:small conductance mechanosensitive channel
VGAAEVSDWIFAKPLTILIIVVVAWVCLRLLRNIIDRFVDSIAHGGEPSRQIKRRLRRSPIAKTLPSGTLDSGAVSLRAAARAQTLGHILKSIASVTVWGIAALMVLAELGVNLAPLIAGAGIAGVALGFGAQSLVKDFLAGIFILVEDQYGVGDIVDLGEESGLRVMGTVESVSMRSTRLRSVEGIVWHVPNGTILRVGNQSQKWARALLDVSVGYGADLDVAQRIIKEQADAVWRDADWSSRVLEEPEVWGVEDLGADGITIRLVVKTQPAEQFKVLRELRFRIKVALDEAGVEIPFPQRTVWVRRDPGSSVESGEDPPDL